MIVELGHFALILALLVAVVQAVVPLAGAARGWAEWMRVAPVAAAAQLVLLALAFGALTHAFVVSDFSVRLVAANSHSAKPMLYKVTGVWGNHEGSLLLWVLILALFGAMIAWRGRNLPAALAARVLAVQAMIGVAFMAFMVFTSNPFERLAVPPVDGQDLNPLLQDPGLAFHPPFLYLGYVGLSTAFSFAVAALIEGRVDPAWARWVRPWTLAAWMFLTVGIALGSYWAYYELGWGGWWFWDPVENASFMPWLIAAALLHSAIVAEKRDSLKSWTVLLAILAFSFSLIGTFIVRSGIITSVHAFASDPARGVFILAILAVAIGGALGLYAWRAPLLAARGVFAPVSRESALVINNVLLTVSALVVFIGTIWPLLAEFLTGAKVSVGPPFFELTFTPFIVLVALVLPVGTLLAWKRGNLARALGRLAPVAALALAVAGLLWSLGTGRSLIAPLGIGLSVWVLGGVLAELAERARLMRAGPAESLRRLWNLPRADWGKSVAHAGLALSIFGIAAISAWETEDIRVMRPGETAEIGGWSLTLDSVERLPVGADFDIPGCATSSPTGFGFLLALFRETGPRNFITDLGRFTLRRNGEPVAGLCAEKRLYPVQRMPTTEAAIDSGWTRDIYVVLGDPQQDGGWAVRSYVKPFAVWIWLGALVMAAGGLISLTDRRYRVGAARRAGAPAGAVAAE
ncbi:MAG: heme lyase CcmF/NrfE family subunit [Alphaproteobacteria bacterium]|nr:MAG: heme lyase CcmF/NrfE family subunit [Alphaproteobacteria bacterium]